MGRSSDSSVAAAAKLPDPAAAALVTVIVQLKLLPSVTEPPTLFVLVTDRSGASGTVALALGDVAPPADALAMLVIDFAARSPAVTT